jgi:hypothetical protein
MSLLKAENPEQYAKLANRGILLGYPVKIAGQDTRPDNGINYHSTIKYFDPSKDHPHKIHDLAQHLPLNPPDAKNTQIKFDKFKDRFGDDVYAVTLHGNSAEKIKEHNGKFAGMGFPSTFEWTPHISVDKDQWDKLKSSGAKTAHEAGIQFGSAHLKKGPKVLRTYHHEPDSAEPKVPDESDFTAKMTAKSEDTMGQKPLMKPYVSEAQRRWAHTSSGKEALGGNAGVHEWDEATKGKKLPERVGKSEENTITTYHGTKTPHEGDYDLKHHKSGFYPGIYSTTDKSRAAEHGTHVYENRLHGKHFEIKDNKHAEALSKEAGGHSGSGAPVARMLQDRGYTGIKRGNEYITFHPDHIKKSPNMEKSEHKVGGVRSPRCGHTIAQLEKLKENNWGNPDTGTEISEEEGQAHLHRMHQNKANKKVQQMIGPKKPKASTDKPEDWFGKGEKGVPKKVSKSEVETAIKNLIKSDHALMAKHGKALALEGKLMKRYLEDNKPLLQEVAKNISKLILRGK